MVENTLDIIENRLKAKTISEYEVLLLEENIFETIFLKDKKDNEREVSNTVYVLRILDQNENHTGIGTIKGNSVEPHEIDKNIETCVRLSKTNTSSKYTFPTEKKIPMVSLVDKKVLKDPHGIQQSLSEELIKNINDQKRVSPTFGRFRIHLNNSFLRNSNGINLKSSKTFFFIEFSLKAEKVNKLSEYWTVDYYKEKEHLDLKNRVESWAKYAESNLKAKIPEPKSNAIVIFPPHVLKDAINKVLGFHSLGRAHYEGVSACKEGEEIASDEFSLFDNGLLEGGLNSNPWDGEGNPHQKTEVISKGIFKNRLYDQKYSLLENVESTGNGARLADGSVGNAMSNFTIVPGNISLKEMISEIPEGYYIEKFSWLNPEAISGFFGAEIRNGYYIKNGEFKNPIKLGNVSGNVLDMLQNCLYISKERKYIENSLFPYITFTGLDVSS